eukprot:TRINITY_DN15149_c0_g1_i1.p1 TRINITY_DN15149_c0_g1~~TRINITY_DN15149_c0_g1_i1.p1  ORF type:complete len:289 (-),score=49.42 TRINITY_DN15149_c0_g1_i1:52-918(-)
MPNRELDSFPEADFLFNIGFCLLGFSYWSTNIIHLRVVLFFASVTLALWSALVLPQWQTGFAWNTWFAILNASHVGILLYRSYNFKFNAKEERLYSVFFNQFSRYEFKKLLEVGQWRKYAAGDVLMVEGDPSHIVAAISHGHCTVTHQEVFVTDIGDDSMVGVVEFFEPHAKVRIYAGDEGVEVYEWRTKVLKKMFRDNPQYLPPFLLTTNAKMTRLIHSLDAEVFQRQTTLFDLEKMRDLAGTKDDHDHELIATGTSHSPSSYEDASLTATGVTDHAGTHHILQSSV